MNVHSPDFESQLNTLDRNRPVLVYCRSGVRSQTAVAVLKRLGFQHIVELQGGITRWNGAIER
jgi:rhodanese-related sulfurtransferase